MCFVAVAVLFLVFFSTPWENGGTYKDWPGQVMPGKLTQAHQAISTKCASCHTSGKGADDAKCITCHAENRAFLQRQPTAFHATIGHCSACHAEHQGVNANMRKMDHEVLAKIGANILESSQDKSPQSGSQEVLAVHPHVSARVATLNCAGCHGTKDKHQGLMGKNCASCHGDTQWRISEFQHPSVNSMTCSQCHQAPPSHYMMHFEMVDKKIATAQKNGCCGAVNVSQCYACHQTTSFNDIKGVGYYKHH